MSRTEIRSLVGGHVPAEDIERDLRFLDARGLAHERVVHTAGRPAHRWYLGGRSKVRGASEERGSDPTFAPTPQALSSGSPGARRGAAQLGIDAYDDSEPRGTGPGRAE